NRHCEERSDEAISAGLERVEAARPAVLGRIRMLQMAGRMAVLGTETAFEVLARANALAAQGRSIINLGIGQPDFPTPAHIVEAGRKALADGHHGYTPANGISPLRAAVARHAHVAVMSDEIYGEILYDGAEHVSLLGYPSIREQVILLDGWSKTYAMTGWRMGYGVWPKALFAAAERLAINCHSCVNA